MSIDHVLTVIRGFAGVVELAPGPGSDYPPIAWGDHFFYHSPDGHVPERGQPYATIVTKDYPDDTRSDLDHPGRYRVNIRVDRATFAELIGRRLGKDNDVDSAGRDYTETDTVLPHPVYAAQSWICVVNPGHRTMPTVLELLATAHTNATPRATR